MNFTIRDIDESDRVIIEDWYRKIGEPPPPRGLMPDGSTFVCDIDGVLALSVSVGLSNFEAAHVESFIGNPALGGETRRRGTEILLRHLEDFARGMGYKRLWCMAPNERLRDYYEKIGFADSGYRVFVLKKEL